MSTSPQIHSIREATLTVSASNSRENYADYRCDGTADEVEIQAAIDALPATGGSVILLDGTFVLGAGITIASYKSLIGTGFGTVLKIKDGLNVDIKVIDDADNPSVNIIVANMTLDGNKANNAAGAQQGLAVKASYSIFYNIYAKNFRNMGIGSFSLSQYLIIENCYAQSCDRLGIHLDVLFNSVIRNCFAWDNGESGIESGPARDCRFEGIESWGNGFNGIAITGTQYRNVLINCNCHGNGYHGIINTDGDNLIIANCICWDNSQDTANTYDGIFVDNQNYSLLIGNRCYDTVAIVADKTQRYGISILSTSTKCRVVDNMLEDNRTAAFFDSGICTVVMNNQGTEITDVRDLVKVTNTSGGALAAGDVVILKAVAAGNEITTTAVLGNDKVFGIAAEAIADTASGLVLVRGKTTVLSASNDHGNIAIGDFLCTNDTAKECCKAAAGDMALAIALEACAAANCVIDALIVSSLKI